MKTDTSVYNLSNKLKNTLNNLKQDRGIAERNKESILKFYEENAAQGISDSRLIRYIQILTRTAKFLNKNFNKATKDDMIKVIGDIENQNYSDWTKHTYKTIIKKFYKWLKGKDKVLPPEVEWINTAMKRSNNLLPEQLLTEEDVIRLADTAENSRDKALVLTLYETGSRTSELLTLKMKNVAYDEYGAILIVTGKTGMRRVRIISSQPALTTWINDHPFKDDPESPIWINLGTKNKYDPLNYEAFRAILIRLAKKIGLKKAVNPHIFRHSRASHLAIYLTEAQMDQYLGWIPGSKMPSIYVHLSGRDVDKTLLKMHGIDIGDEEKEVKIKIQICTKCKEKNSPTSRFCNRCGAPLDMQTMLRIDEKRAKADDVMNSLLSDPGVQSVIRKKLKEMSFTI